MDIWISSGICAAAGLILLTAEISSYLQLLSFPGQSIGTGLNISYFFMCYRGGFDVSILSRVVVGEVSLPEVGVVLSFWV